MKYNQYPQVDATTACGYQASWVKDKHVIALEKTTAGDMEKIYLHPTLITKTLNLHGTITQDFVKMTQTDIGNGFDKWFDCWGEFGLGCLDTPYTSGPKTQDYYWFTMPSTVGAF